MTTRIGFIGLGKLGQPMALRLLQAGHRLVVHNRSRGIVDEFADLGAVPASSASEVAHQSDVVFTALALPSIVETVYLGPGGVAEAARPGLVCIDHSTVGPDLARRIAASLEPRGVAALDAPVSGGPEGAAAGTLAIMVGGEQSAFERARPLLDLLGKRIVYCGPSGAGATMKLVNQVLITTHSAAAAEAMVFARRMGVDLAQMLDVVSSGLGASAMLSRNGSRVLQADYRAGAKLELVVKDAALIRELCDAANLDLPVFLRAKRSFEEAYQLGFAEHDLASVIAAVVEGPAMARNGHPTAGVSPSRS